MSSNALLLFGWGDVEFEIRKCKMVDISIYSAEGGSAPRQTTPDMRYWGLKERMVGQAPPYRLRKFLLEKNE